MKSINDLSKLKTTYNLVDDLIKNNGLYILVAKPKVGKSLLALQLAHSLANGTLFLDHQTYQSPVFYISTELTDIQLKDRINKTDYHFPDNQFFYAIKSSDYKLDLRNDLLIDLKEFSEEYKGKLVIVDMMTGIDYGSSYDLNSYTEISSQVMDKYRELSKKYNLTFLLVHHINKNGKTLGSTGIEGFVDGIFYLSELGNNKYILTIISRDFPSNEINLIRNDNLQFKVTTEEVEELDYNLNIFLKYVIKLKEITFTPSEIVSTLNLQVSPTKFGQLLNSNIKRLEQEGVSITKNKTAVARNYKATFNDPMIDITNTTNDNVS